jgi:nicotinamidase-related amidase
MTMTAHNSNLRRRWAAIASVAALTALGVQAHAQGILDSWTTTAVPPPPKLEPATVDAAHSALLILDMYPTSCSEAQRPSCVKTIPHVKRLLDEARAHKMLVVYSAGPPAANGPTRPVEVLAPASGEPTVRGAADKWLGSELEKVLTEHSIKTVIVTGTSADGAVLYTASGAALRDITAIVPVDGISSANPFAELYTVWHLKNTTGTVSRHIVLTKSDQVTIR